MGSAFFDILVYKHCIGNNKSEREHITTLFVLLHQCSRAIIIPLQPSCATQPAHHHLLPT